MTLNEVDLPATHPTFDLLLAADRGDRVTCVFEVDQSIDAVLGCETVHGFAVLEQANAEVVGHADVQAL